MLLFGVFIEKYLYTKFHLDWLLAIVMYGLKLFIVALQELHCLPNCLHVCTITVRGAITSPSFVTLLLLVSEIAKYIA